MGDKLWSEGGGGASKLVKFKKKKKKKLNGMPVRILLSNLKCEICIFSHTQKNLQCYFWHMCLVFSTLVITEYDELLKLV